MPWVAALILAWPLGLRAADPTPHVRTAQQVRDTAALILAAYAAPEVAAKGLLDVTVAPYAADPTGATDSTAALQQAIVDARDAQLVAYLPAGTYRVSDTIECIQGHITPEVDPNTGQILTTNLDYPCRISGPPEGARARIVLADASPGFDTQADPRIVLFLWARDWYPPHEDMWPILADYMGVRHLDFDLGSGNPGAVAVDLHGGGGSGIVDLSIDAYGAFAGIWGLPGSASDVYGVTIRGGRFGFFGSHYYTAAEPSKYLGYRATAPGAVILVSELEDQTEAAIYFDGRGPLTFIGGRIQGAGVVCASGNGVWDGACGLVDSAVVVTNGGPALSSSRSAVLIDTHVAGAADILVVEGAPVLSADPNTWTRADYLAAAPAQDYGVWQDGIQVAGPQSSVTFSSGPPPADPGAAHRLEEPFVSWASAQARDVREAPYFAAGDGVTDDTAALQLALDENDVVYLPKGDYRISSPLLLHAQTRLVGVSRRLSKITPLEGAPAFSDPNAPSPLLTSPDDALATTVIAHLTLRARIMGSYALEWRSGRRSVVRDVQTGKPGKRQGHRPDYPTIRIHGHGGGRWFQIISGAAGRPGQRALEVVGTREPLAFYATVIEQALNDANDLFTDTYAHLDDVRDVSFYGLKAEHWLTNLAPVLRVQDSRRLQIVGFGGNNMSHPASTLLRFTGCDDFLVANAVPQVLIQQGVVPEDAGAVIEDMPTGGPLARPMQTEEIASYIRGSPDVLLPGAGFTAVPAASRWALTILASLLVGVVATARRGHAREDPTPGSSSCPP